MAKVKAKKKTAKSTNVNAACPRCKSENVVVERSMPEESGIRVRYNRCRGCRFLFKTVNGG